MNQESLHVIKLSFLNILFTLLILTGNILYSIKNSLVYSEYAFITIPFIILLFFPIYAIITKDIEWIGIFYIASSLFISILGSRDNVASTIFIIYALKIFQNNSSIKIILALFIFFTIAKFFLIQYDYTQIINILIFNLGSVISYYLIFNKKNTVK